MLTDLSIDDGPFTSREFARVIFILKWKCARPDGIPLQVLNNGKLMHHSVHLQPCSGEQQQA